MTRIVIRTVSDVKKLNKKLKSVIVKLPTLQKFALERAADEAILTSIHRDMETNNFSKKIIDRTFVGDVSVNNNKITVHFISEYVSDGGFDVSKAREEGTRDHDVFPKKPGGWLTWIDDSTGKRIFRKQSHPSGIKRLLIIENNINRNKEKFKDSYAKEISSKLQQALR